MKSKSFSALATALLVLVAKSSLACGPYFPNNLLDNGDHAVLVAPAANFENELLRMKLVTSRFRAVNNAADYAEEGTLNEQIPGELRVFHNSMHADETIQTESRDLRAALKQANISKDESERLNNAHLVEREKLRKYLAVFIAWENSGGWTWGAHGEHGKKPETPAPAFPQIEIAKDLPGEFADYFDGALAWHNPAISNKDVARASWEHLLARPEAERKFKSTWAAFMLGKSWEKENPDKAVEYFQQVRDLAKHGFADSTGLAAASLGLEARIYLAQEKFERAIDLYLEQFATGDSTALNSLRFTAATALKTGSADSLHPLAANPKTQRVITACLVSFHPPGDNPYESDNNITKVWLAAVETANVKDVESAEKLALAAYRANAMDLAQRWIKRAPDSPVTQWLQAKLLLRDGKVKQAAALLAKVTRSFPPEPPSTNTPASFAENLSVVINSEYDESLSAGQQALGELGVLHLARREYTQSLDALLRSSYWMDAAYVAERVLTPDELKNYVNENWPSVSPEESVRETKDTHDGESLMTNPRQQIRYLLARRLTRLSRGNEAREYFPAEWQPQFDAFMKSLDTGWDESLPAEQRARALFAAAFIARTNGMELLSTEVEPDWSIYGGGYAWSSFAESRTNDSFKYLGASADELRRSGEHHPNPEERFHYRYQAAFLGWEAAKLLPDNSDETARILCTAGSWLKDRDPDTADIFYKALMRRCRKTAIGALADKIRWFPVLDENGNLKLARLELATPPKPGEIDSGEYPIPGKYFVFHKDDQLRDLAPAVQRLGFSITTKDIIAANPGLSPMTIEIGQKIFIPLPKTNSESATVDAPEPSKIDEKNLGPTPENQPVSGETYMIQSGDSLVRIAHAASALGRPMTIQDILEANPGLDATRIKVGQVINIPAPKTEEPAQ